jgi:hypothetical protein
LEGRRIYWMFRTGRNGTYEEEIKVSRFRRILEPTKDHGNDPARGSNPSEASRKARLLQFYDGNGRLRTMDIADIADVL